MEPNQSESDNVVSTSKGAIQDLAAHLRGNAERVNEPRAQALFETSAEVLLGLVNAYNDYIEAQEPAWKR